MGKKVFVDTGLYAKPWFRVLPPRIKCLWEWLRTNCDNAGVIDFDDGLASFQIGEKVTVEDLDSFGNRVEKIGENKYWLTGVIEFQYGELKKDYNPHKPVFKSLKKHGLISRVGQDLPESSQRLVDKNKDKNKDKDKDKAKKKEEDVEIENTIFDSVVQLWNTQLGGQKKFQHCQGLKPKQVEGFFQIIKKYKTFRDVATWNQVFTRVKSHPFLNGSKSSDAWVCSLGWLCVEFNALGVLNGEYGSDSGASGSMGKTFEEHQREVKQYQEKLRAVE